MTKKTKIEEDRRRRFIEDLAELQETEDEWYDPESKIFDDDDLSYGNPEA